MKKIISYIKLLIIFVIAGLIIFLVDYLTNNLGSGTGSNVNQEFLDVYPSATNVDDTTIDDMDESINKVMEVSDNSGQVGYIFDTTSNSGYGGNINFLIGISNEGIIQGFKPISHSETGGYGSRISSEEIINGIKDVNITDGISSGEGNKEDGEITAISGATITTNAIVNQIKVVVNEMSKLSEDIKPISEEIPYYAGKYNELFKYDLDLYSFSEFNNKEIFEESVERIIRVKNKKEEVDSYILQLSSQGYGGNIETLVRVNSEYRVFNAVFAKHNETPDFGGYIDDDIYKDEIKGLNLDKNFLTKAIKIKKEPVGEKDILLISGATITSKAVQKALNGAIDTLVDFDKYRDDENNYSNLVLEDLLKEDEDEIPSYNHTELFEGVESSELIEGVSNDLVLAVSKAVKDGEEGYIFDVIGSGFAGNIEYGIFTNSQGVIKDFVVYNSNESEGYGAAIKEDSYKNKLIDTNLSDLEKFSAGENIEAISGATITTDAMVSSMNSVLEIFKSLGQ